MNSAPRHQSCCCDREALCPAGAVAVRDTAGASGNLGQIFPPNAAVKLRAHTNRRKCKLLDPQLHPLVPCDCRALALDEQRRLSRGMPAVGDGAARVRAGQTEAAQGAEQIVNEENWKSAAAGTATVSGRCFAAPDSGTSPAGPSGPGGQLRRCSRRKCLQNLEGTSAGDRREPPVAGRIRLLPHLLRLFSPVPTFSEIHCVYRLVTLQA